MSVAQDVNLSQFLATMEAFELAGAADLFEWVGIANLRQGHR